MSFVKADMAFVGDGQFRTQGSKERWRHRHVVEGGGRKDVIIGFSFKIYGKMKSIAQKMFFFAAQ